VTSGATSRSLAGAAWLSAGALPRLLGVLDGNGEEARVVGGAVRNALLGIAIHEIDVATTAVPDEVVKRVTAAGFKQGTVATAGDQTRKATIVAYMPGHSTAAAAVAKELKLGSASVQPVDASTQAIACQTTPCTATVVVTVGADLSSQ